jgi:hypothetical protein
LTEPETKVAGPDGADDGVARARRIDIDPRVPEVNRLVGVVDTLIHLPVRTRWARMFHGVH